MNVERTTPGNAVRLIRKPAEIIVRQKLFIFFFVILTLGFIGHSWAGEPNQAPANRAEAELRATERAVSLKLNALAGFFIAAALAVTGFAIYKMGSKRTIGNRRRLLFSTVSVLIPVAVFVLAYMGYAAHKSAPLYDYIKTNQRGWKGHVHRADTVLGFAPAPNSAGAEVFPIEPNIPMRYDEKGFRVPVEVEAISRQRPLILALGCSFTYGAAVRAQNAFPHLVGLSLNGTSKNAGVCGYGLSQMLILARRLVPTYQPDYLLVQYSEWLVDRVQMPFAPFYFGEVPTPFLYLKDGRLVMHPPVFLTKLLDLPIDRYRNTPRNWMDGLSFYLHVGLPLSAHDDFNMFKYGSAKSMGLIPDPANSRKDLVRYVYKKIDDAAKAHGSRTVIVILGNEGAPVVPNEELFPPDAILVNAQDALLGQLSDPDSANYLKEYAHWRGSPPTLVDNHPNEKAHRIIADAVVSAIRQAGTKLPDKNQ